MVARLSRSRSGRHRGETSGINSAFLGWLRRRSESLAATPEALVEQYGNELAQSVEAVLAKPLTTLAPKLAIAAGEVALPFA